ncbi:MAG TPA: folylpolyglutamate synthase/dihydrofolate synthase family protein [Gaiellaceae bacterium]|nr:folylpolyglutamate synthase/dihydrofolate synthase family protein [Gaiellaceae bacterium]
MSAYRAALDFLFARTTGKTKFGLERTRELLAALGDPHQRLRCFHVAGTNGKGSVCATLETILRASGMRVGKYTSPHLVDFRERVVVDGVAISEADVIAWVDRWTDTCERLGATFFEATTVLAFDHFASAGVDVAVIETGLGGRLDSTNVIERPLAAGVTSIAVDHTEYLGDTLEQIAAEKAGIFKAGRPAIVGELDPDIRALLARLAAEAGASPVRVLADEARVSDVRIGPWGTSFLLEQDGRATELTTGLVGRHQAANAVVALAMLDAAGPPYAVSLAEASRALVDVRLPGRFERDGVFLFDVAHNPDGAAVLARTMREVGVPGPVVAVLAVLSDKDWRGMIDALAPAVDRFVLTIAPTAPESRLWNPDEALAFARQRGLDARVERDFARALGDAPTDAGTVAVTGSFHTVGDAVALLQRSPARG